MNNILDSIVFWRRTEYVLAVVNLTTCFFKCITTSILVSKPNCCLTVTRTILISKPKQPDDPLRIHEDVWSFYLFESFERLDIYKDNSSQSCLKLNSACFCQNILKPHSKYTNSWEFEVKRFKMKNYGQK
jgi:hypothetical protein